MDKQVKSRKLLRLPDVLNIFPVSKSTWWQGVKDGKYPASVKLGRNITAWHARDIYTLIEPFELNKKDEK